MLGLMVAASATKVGAVVAVAAVTRIGVSFGRMVSRAGMLIIRTIGLWSAVSTVWIATAVGVRGAAIVRSGDIGVNREARVLAKASVRAWSLRGAGTRSS